MLLLPTSDAPALKIWWVEWNTVLRIIIISCYPGFEAIKYRNLNDTKNIFNIAKLITIHKMPVLSAINRHDILCIITIHQIPIIFTRKILNYPEHVFHLLIRRSYVYFKKFFKNLKKSPLNGEKSISTIPGGTVKKETWCRKFWERPSLTLMQYSSYETHPKQP